MAVQHPTSTAPRLGAYLDCSPQALETALGRQVEPDAAKRLGEVLLDAREISRDNLLSSIHAQRVDRLRACVLFEKLQDEDLALLADGFEEISFTAGEQFITQDESDPYIYVLASGALEVFRTNEEDEDLRFTTIVPGEPVGEMGYFSGGLRSASVRTLEDSELLRAHYDQLTRSFELSSNVANAFVNLITGRLRRTNELFQQNKYRLQTAERSLKHLNEFLDLSEAAALGAGIEGLMDRLVRTASNITDADRASMFLIDAATGELWSKVAEGADVKEIRVAAGAGIIGWVAEHKQILNITEAYDDDRFNPAVDKTTGYRTRTILCAPMWSLQNHILGVVQVINKRTGVFNEEDEALLRAFAHQAAVAVENFNLYRKMMLNHKKMAIMLDIATSISQTLDLSALIREIVSKTTQVLQCERGSFFVLDHETRELWSMEAHGSELKEIRFPASAGLAGHAASNGEIVNISDAYEDPRFNPAFDQKSGYRTKSVLCVPVLGRDGRINGVTQAINKVGGVFDNEDIELVRAIASQIGVAVENAKLHASTLNMKNYLESVQQSISNCILTLDQNFRIVTANKAAVQMFPTAAVEAGKRDVRDVFGPDNAHLMKRLKRVHETRASVVEYDLELHDASGAEHTINLNVLPLTDTEDEFQGLVLVFEDITKEKRVKSAFSHYLAPAVIEQLLADPNRLKLGGEKRELTTMFTDIAGFTSVSERTEPAELVRLLNEYFDHTCGIVLRHGGTIDKIVGDALHIMFNAPTDQDDHAERAVRCALELADFCESFVAKQVGQGIPLGYTRIGVNTGTAVVGNFGGSARFDYTAYGDSINVAARLEGANRYFGTHVCISKTTKERCSAEIFRPIGRLMLKGKSKAIEAFEPLNKAKASTEQLREYLEAYELLERDDPSAADAFRALAARYPDDPLVAFHLGRLSEGQIGTTIIMTGK